jgi:DNA-binding MarR family transcriptional regulator
MNEKTQDEKLMDLFREFTRHTMRKAGKHGPHRHMHDGSRPEEMPTHVGPRPEGRPPHGGHRPFPRERVLTLLLSEENGMHQKDILERIRIRPSSLSELIDKLEADGYVSRTADPEDRRAAMITLSEAGKTRALEVRAEHAELAKQFFSPLSEEEKAQLEALLRKLLPPREDRPFRQD